VVCQLVLGVRLLGGGRKETKGSVKFSNFENAGVKTRSITIDGSGEYITIDEVSLSHSRRGAD